MKPKTIYVSWIKTPISGIMLFPFLLIRKNLKGSGKANKIINHETIHFHQAIETLVLPFYIIYVINYLLNLLKYKNHNTAYKNILAEKEAFSNDSNLDYLETRKKYCWLS